MMGTFRRQSPLSEEISKLSSLHILLFIVLLLLLLLLLLLAVHSL